MDPNWILYSENGGLVPYAPFYTMLTLVVSIVLHLFGCFPSSITTSAAFLFSLVAAFVAASITILRLCGTLVLAVARFCAWLPRCMRPERSKEELELVASWLARDKALFWSWVRSLPATALSILLARPMALWSALSAQWLTCPWHGPALLASCIILVLVSALRPRVLLWTILWALWAVGRVGFVVITEIWKIPLWTIVIAIDVIEILEPYCWIIFYVLTSLFWQLCWAIQRLVGMKIARQGPPDVLRRWRRDDGSTQWRLPEELSNPWSREYQLMMDQLLQEESKSLWES